MNDTHSCIIRHFNHYANLTEDDKQLLCELERSPVDTRAGQLLWQESESAEEFCTLRSGWAFSFRHLEDGSRQILELYLPGDIIGLREFAFSQRLAGVMMIDDGVICRFPHQHLLDLFQRSATLTTILFAVSSCHQALLTERLVNLARRSAFQKVCHLLFETYTRLERTGEGGDGRFRLPLSQEQLADALGLSAVHVSRTFTLLNERGLVFRNRHWVEIPDLQDLSKACDFNGCYLNDNLRKLGAASLAKIPSPSSSAG